MEYADNRCQAYCPWLDKSPTSLRSNDSQKQQRIIPKKIKKLIDGDLAAISGSGRSTRDRLKEKLRRKQEHIEQKFQETQTQVSSAPTYVEQSQGKQKKRRKKLKKEDEAECTVTKEVKLTKKITNENSRRVAVCESFGHIDKVVHGEVDKRKDGLNPADREKPTEEAIEAGRYGKRRFSEIYSIICKNIHQKLRGNQTVEQCLLERLKLVERMKDEVEMLKIKTLLLPKEIKEKLHQVWMQSIKLNATALQKLKAKGKVTFRHEMINSSCEVDSKIETKRGICPKKYLNIPCQLSVIGQLSSKRWSRIVESLTGQTIKAFVARLDHMIVSNADFTSYLQEIRHMHLAEYKDKVYLSLKHVEQYDLLQMKLKINPKGEKIPVLEMRMLEVSTWSQIYVNIFTLAKCLSKAFQLQDTKLVLLCVVMDKSMIKGHFTDIVLDVQNDYQLELLVAAAYSQLKKQIRILGPNFAMRPNMSHNVCLAYIAHNLLIFSEFDIRFGSSEIFDVLGISSIANLLESENNTFSVEELLAAQVIQSFVLAMYCLTSTAYRPTIFRRLRSLRLADSHDTNFGMLRITLAVAEQETASRFLDTEIKFEVETNKNMGSSSERYIKRMYSPNTEEQGIGIAKIVDSKSTGEISFGHFAVDYSGLSKYKCEIKKAENKISKYVQVNQTLLNAYFEEVNKQFMFKNLKEKKIPRNAVSGRDFIIDASMSKTTHFKIGNTRLEDQRKEISSDIAFEIKFVTELAKQITATQVSRKYIARLNEQMVKQLSNEREVDDQIRKNTPILSIPYSREGQVQRMYNASKQEEQLLLKQKLQDNEVDSEVGTVKDINNQSFDTVSTADRNHTCTLNNQGVQESHEQPEMTEIIVNIEQAHYGIRLCVFD